MRIKQIAAVFSLAAACAWAQPQQPPQPPQQPLQQQPRRSPGMGGGGMGMGMRQGAGQGRQGQQRQALPAQPARRLQQGLGMMNGQGGGAGAARPLERVLGGPAGRWWTRPQLIERLGITADQRKKMDDTFQQHRLKLIDLNAGVQKEEAIMEPLVAAEQPDEGKIVAQIDKVAQARAELEKANARMLLGIRRTLTPEQWSKLKAQPAEPQPARGQAPPPPQR